MSLWSRTEDGASGRSITWTCPNTKQNGCQRRSLAYDGKAFDPIATDFAIRACLTPRQPLIESLRHFPGRGRPRRVGDALNESPTLLHSVGDSLSGQRNTTSQTGRLNVSVVLVWIRTAIREPPCNRKIERLLKPPNPSPWTARGHIARPS